MALKIASYMTEYGEEKENIYCCVTECKYDPVKCELLFSIRPFASKAAKDSGYSPLPIGALDLAGIIKDVAHDDDLMAKAYDWIKKQIIVATEEQAEEKAMSADPVYEKALKWREYAGCVDC